MFDDLLRRIKEKAMEPVAVWLGWLAPASATVIALLFGVGAAVLAWQQLYLWAFVCWFMNRVFDGLDGTMARLQGRKSDFGGYLDIVLDFVVYAAIPVGLTAGLPSTTNFVALSFLLAGFYVNSASWLYLSAILEKRKQGAGEKGEMTTVTFPAGLIGGGETILFFSLFIAFPSYIALLFSIMAGLVGVTVAQRLVWAKRNL